MGGTLTSSAFTCTSICHCTEPCKCVCIYREADVNHICPVFLAKREREIFVTRVIGFPAICIKISRCDCWCLTWDQLKKEGISRTNCVHVDTWLVCVCVCASLLQCVCVKVKQNFSSKNSCPLLGPSFCLLSFPLQIFSVPQTIINLYFLDTFLILILTEPFLFYLPLTACSSSWSLCSSIQAQQVPWRRFLNSINFQEANVKSPVTQQQLTKTGSSIAFGPLTSK